MHTQGLPDFVNPTKIEKNVSPLLTAGLSSQITWTHGFDSAPDFVIVELCILTAENNYSVGDVIQLNAWFAESNAVDRGVTTVVTDTEVQIIQSSGGLIIINKTAFGTTGVTESNQAWRITAWKFTIGDVPDITTVGLVPVASGYGTSAATLDLDISNPQYDNYELWVDELVPSTDNTILHLLVSTDNGATFKTGAADYAWGVSQHQIASSIGAIGDVSDSEIQLSGTIGQGNLTNEDCSFRIKLANPHGINKRFKIGWEGDFMNSTPVEYSFTGTGKYIGGTDAVTDIRLVYASGNIATVKYELYGYRKLP